jgi:HD-GYP domain-containing protein (c-di-GMP phosphodiesterase class II)
MVTTRAYRAARSQAWAIAELRRCAGTQFDPDVVEAVVQSLRAGEAAAPAGAPPAAVLAAQPLGGSERA